MLETRKERILDGFRARRELLTAITKMTLAARKFGERLPETADQELLRTWNAERDRHYNLMRQYAQQMSDDLDRYVPVYNRAVYELLISYAFCVHGVVLSRRPRHRQAEIVAQLGEPMSMVVQVPRPWRTLAWGRSQDKARRLIAEIEEASVPSASATTKG
jgi:hypothetical protein